jgi:uncharacterized protein YukE
MEEAIMSELKAIAAAAARYSSENVELRAALQEIEKRIDSILRSDYPGEELWTLHSYVREINRKLSKDAS